MLQFACSIEYNVIKLDDVVIYNDEVWHNCLNFRDYINSHKKEAKVYSRLKRKLAKQYPWQRSLYTQLKLLFIEDILLKAAQWRKTL